MCEVSNLIFMEGKNEGIAEGKAAGIAEGKAAGIAEGKASGIAEGIAKGEVKGELNTKRASAVRIHAMGLQDSMIAAGLDAALEDVQAWIAEDFIPA